MLEYSLFRASCDVKEEPGNSDKIKLYYSYRFVPYPGMDKVEARKVQNKEIDLLTGMRKRFPKIYWSVSY